MNLPPRRDLLFVGIQLLLFVAWWPDLLPLPLRVPTWLTWSAWVLAAAATVFGCVAALQLGSTLTPWPSPKASGQLVTSGTYGVARHPIYAALLVFGVAISLATGSLWRLLVTLGLYLLFCRKAKYEEQLLLKHYPAYSAYADRVSRFGW